MDSQGFSRDNNKQHRANDLIQTFNVKQMEDEALQIPAIERTYGFSDL